MAKAKAQSTELTSVQERIKKRIESINETTQQPSGVNISLKGSVFKLPNGQTSSGPLNCIIIDYTNQNIFYEGGYIEGEYTDPTCMATGRLLKEMTPSNSIEKPINAACESCSHNKFGSSGRGKLCKNTVILAIIPDDFTTESEVFTVKVSPTGLQSWTNYLRSLQAIGIDPAQVITSMSFVSGLSYPQLAFKSAGENKKIEEIAQFIASADSILTVD